MELYVLIAKDRTILGIYSNKEKLISDLTTTFANAEIGKTEKWEVNKGFINYINISKKTIVTIEN